jgi:hypothetical protein
LLPETEVRILRYNKGKKVMNKYKELRMNPPKLVITPGAREVIFKTISCMCDNVHYLTFKKNNDGDFKMSGNGFALSNFSMKHPIHDIEWEADENEWGGVIAMINSGTSVVEEVKSR